MYALHNLPPGTCEPPADSTEAAIVYPPPVPLRGEAIDARGAYLVDSARLFVLWLGAQLDQQVLRDLFNVDVLPADATQLQLTAIVNGSAPLAKRVAALLAALREERGAHPDVLVIAQGQPSEHALFPYLIEDRGAGGAGTPGYGDYLQGLARQVASAR